MLIIKYLNNQRLIKLVISDWWSEHNQQAAFLTNNPYSSVFITLEPNTLITYNRVLTNHFSKVVRGGKNHAKSEPRIFHVRPKIELSEPSRRLCLIISIVIWIKLLVNSSRDHSTSLSNCDPSPVFKDLPCCYLWPSCPFSHTYNHPPAVHN